MRISMCAAVLAAFALSACGDNAEGDLNDEALSMEEIEGEMDDFAMPQAGEYRSMPELISMEGDGIPAGVQEMMKQAFAEGANMESTYCLTEQMTREQWVSSMAESNCTVSKFDTSGNNIDAVMACNSPDGLAGTVAMTGTMNDNSSDVEMTFDQEVPEFGAIKMKMRVKSERIGDCA